MLSPQAPDGAASGYTLLPGPEAAPPELPAASGSPYASANAIPPSTVSEVLQAAVKEDLFSDGSAGVTDAPVVALYDLDAFDQHLEALTQAFSTAAQPCQNGKRRKLDHDSEIFTHCLAVKSCPLTRLLRHACHTHNLGLETASIGELLHATDHVHVDPTRVVFDSPAKTRRELEHALRSRIHVNLDNYAEFARAKEIVEKIELEQPEGFSFGPIGFRINPLVGAGSIQALSVSTSSGKFGVPLDEENRKRLVGIYRDAANSRWLTGVHVHVGSGGMGVKVLAAGIQVAVEFAKEVNGEAAPGAERNGSASHKIIRYVDIGGGLPANYCTDEWATWHGEEAQSTSTSNIIPSFEAYARHLRAHVPDLFSGYFEKVITEFGQSVFAKVGFLASRIEFLKAQKGGPRTAVIHYGADCCPRQAYTKEHARRVEAYKASGEEFEPSPATNGAAADASPVNIAGPLCFQGDYLAYDLPLPPALSERDIIVLKDVGANSLGMFSRHCSRMSPAVYGYRRGGSGGSGVRFVQIRKRETPAALGEYWGS